MKITKNFYKNSKKAQIGVEFVIILGAVLFFMTAFLLTIQNNAEDKLYKREDMIVKEIALTVQNEINMAASSINGYSRNFTIPSKAGNLDYEINLTSDVVYIRTKDGKHAMALPVSEVVGEIQISENKIEKINGVVYLNQ